MRGRRVLLQLTNRAYRASLAPARARFERAARDPAGAQAERLRGVLERAAATAFGREHGLASGGGRARTLEDYQAAVPVRGWDALAPWIDRALEGEPAVLTPETPALFEKSSGSTRASKYVPYPPGLLAEFSAATGPWIHDLLTARPALLGGSAYWSISPSGPKTERTPGGARVGLEDDTEYFPAPVRALLRVILPVPPDVARLPTIDACRYATLKHLAGDARLGLVSVWSPSFLLLLLDALVTHAGRLEAELPRARARALREAVFEGDLSRLWPRLAVVSCWTDGAAQRLLPELRRRLPATVEIQGKGLLATEGVVSFPLCELAPGSGCVLAVGSHLLELGPTDGSGERPVLPHEAVLGRRYAPILSTAGGLYRYRLGDEVEVTGRYRETPCVRFLGRLDGVVDFAGEKLSPGFVESALSATLREVGVDVAFALVAPLLAESPVRYVLFVETAATDALPALGAALERRLRASHHYDHCRELGQLEAVRVVAVRDGARRYEAALMARGTPAGSIKPPSLHGGAFWGEVFGVPARPT